MPMLKEYKVRSGTVDLEHDVQQVLPDHKAGSTYAITGLVLGHGLNDLLYTHALTSTRVPNMSPFVRSLAVLMDGSDENELSDMFDMFHRHRAPTSVILGTMFGGQCVLQSQPREGLPPLARLEPFEYVLYYTVVEGDGMINVTKE